MVSELEEFLASDDLSFDRVDSLASKLDVYGNRGRPQLSLSARPTTEMGRVSSAVLRKSVAKKLLDAAIEYQDLKFINSLLKFRHNRATKPDALDFLNGFQMPSVAEFSSTSSARFPNESPDKLGPGIPLVWLHWPGPASDAYRLAVARSGGRVAYGVEICPPPQWKAVVKRTLSTKESTRVAVSNAAHLIATANFPEIAEYSPPRLQDFCDRVFRIPAASPSDPKVARLLRSLNVPFALFTGGGILTESFLTEIEKKILHFHPGLLPMVRGSDGFFWSMATRGLPAISGFWMNRGIDTGEIVYRREFTAPKFPAQLRGLGWDAVYRGVLSSIDLNYRATGLEELLRFWSGKKWETSAELGREQSWPKELPRQYHFMHPAVRAHVIKNLVDS